MNINIPCRELKMEKRYAMMTVLSLIYMSPKAQVNPNRQRRAIAPITHDLWREEKIQGYQKISPELIQPCHINDTDTEKKVMISCNDRKCEASVMYKCLKILMELQVIKLEVIYMDENVMNTEIHLSKSRFVP